MRLGILIAAGAMLAVSARADASDTVDAAAQQFITCAGAYNWTSATLAQAGKPAASEHMRGYGRGAQTVAQWILASEYNLANEASPRPMGDWKDFVEVQIDRETVRLAAMAEMDDQDGIRQILENCTALSEVQAKIINDLRKQWAPQPE